MRERDDHGGHPFPSIIKRKQIEYIFTFLKKGLSWNSGMNKIEGAGLLLVGGCLPTNGRKVRLLRIGTNMATMYLLLLYYSQA